MRESSRVQPFTVVIPALNEAASIQELIKRLMATSAELGIPDPEIVVVNDGSEDDTGQICRNLGVVVINHAAPLGYGKSIKDGISLASNDIILIMDADNTYPPESIPDFLAMSEAGFNMVVGSRSRQNLGRTFTRPLLRYFVSFVCGQRVLDVNSGMRLFRKSEAMAYLPNLCNTFSFTTSLTMAYHMTGRTIGYVPIAYGARAGKSHVRSVRDSLRMIQTVAQSAAYYNPIKLFLFLGLLSSVLALGLILAGLIARSSVIVAIGLQSLFIPFILLAIGFAVDVLREKTGWH